MSAVQKHGPALVYASQARQNDKPLVLAAVEHE